MVERGILDKVLKEEFGVVLPLQPKQNQIDNMAEMLRKYLNLAWTEQVVQNLKDPDRVIEDSMPHVINILTALKQLQALETVQGLPEEQTESILLDDFLRDYGLWVGYNVVEDPSSDVSPVSYVVDFCTESWTPPKSDVHAFLSQFYTPKTASEFLKGMEGIWDA